jgi:predicted DNA-binding transcriptional regulator YafY
MRKADRLFQLVNIIRNQQPITAAELAQRLEVSERSIYRYIDDLSLSGIPIYGEAGKGYSLQQGFELPPLNLTLEEIEALHIAMDLLSKTTGFTEGSAGRSLLSKIEAGLDGIHFQLDDKSVFSMVDLLDKQQKNLWAVFRQGIKQRTVINICYMSLSETESGREVLPLGLFYWGGKWTLGTWCLLRQDYRDFRLDRISKATIAEQQPEMDATINLNNYIQHQATNSTDNTLSGGTN